MFTPFSELRGFEVVGREVGRADERVALGTLEDLHVDVRDWRLSHLVVGVGAPLVGRRVLLGTDRPVAFDLARRELLTEWTPYDVETAPDAGSVRTAGDGGGADPDAPAGEGGGLLFGPGDPGAPGGGGKAVLGGDVDAVPAPPSEEERHLCTARSVIGRTVAGTDDEVGTVTDLLVDRDRPSVAWLVIDTGGWLAHREVVLDPKWTAPGSWAGPRASVELTRERVRAAPALESLDGLDHAYGAALAAFYRFVS